MSILLDTDKFPMHRRNKRREVERQIAKGKEEQLEGKIVEVAGDITGSEKQQLKGKVKQLKGKLRETAAEAVD